MKTLFALFASNELDQVVATAAAAKTERADLRAMGHAVKVLAITGCPTEGELAAYALGDHARETGRLGAATWAKIGAAHGVTIAPAKL